MSAVFGLLVLAVAAHAADPVAPGSAQRSNAQQQAALGVFMSESNGQVRVIGLAPGSPAAQAGIRVGDELRKVNDESIKTARGMTDEIAEFEPGDHVTLTIQRNGAEQQLHATLGARSSVFAAQQAGRGRAAYSMGPNSQATMPRATRAYSVAPGYYRGYTLSPGTYNWLDRTDLRRSSGARGWARDHGPRQTVFGTTAPED